MSEEHINSDRTIVKIIRELCQEKSIDLRSYSYDWIFSLKKDDSIKHIYGYRFDLNSTAAGFISQDKVATYQILTSMGVPAVPHTLVSSHQRYYDDIWTKDAHTWQRFLLKPTNGAGGRNIFLFDNIDMTNDFIHTHEHEVWAVSPFLSIIKETRIVMLDNNVLLAFEKTSPVTVHGVPMFNLRLGAKAVTIDPSQQYIELASRAQRALGLRFAAIDIVEIASGELLVLETNDGFSLEYYSLQEPDNISKARDVYSAAIDAMMK